MTPVRIDEQRLVNYWEHDVSSYLSRVARTAGMVGLAIRGYL